MNVDRVPDPPDDPGGAPDPGRAAETPRLTDSAQPQKSARPNPDPEHHPPPDQPPPPDRQPDQERQPNREPDPLEPFEPRSRQEHAQPRSANPVEEASPTDVTTREEISEDSARDHPADESPSDDLPLQAGSSTDDNEVGETTQRHDDKPSDHEGRLSEDAAAPSPVTEVETSSESTDDAPPVQDWAPPLTDQGWSEHRTDVRVTLDKARAAGLTTDRLYTIDPDHKEWSVERNRLQGSLVADLYERARDVPCDCQAIIAGGLGGAGKTTVLTGHAGIDLSRYLTINPDDIKEEMARRGMIPEIDKLSPMEASDLAHEESSYIAKRLALRAMGDGKNIIWDITMSSQASTRERINNLRDAAYAKVDGVFVDIPPEISVARTESRHREGHEQWRVGHGLGGRFVPPEVTRRQLDSEWGSQNRRTYEAMKEKLTSWSTYDNSVDGRSPVLIESSKYGKPGIRDTERST